MDLSELMQTRVFHCPRMAGMAERFVASHPDDYRIEKIDWNSFPDSWPDLDIKKVDRSVEGRNIVAFMAFRTPEDVFSRFAVLRALLRYGAENMLLVLPYYPTATMERVDREGRIATAMSFAVEFRKLPVNARVFMVTYDIHSPAVRFYLPDTIIPKMVSALPLLVERIKDDDYTIAFPDEGAYKRFAEYFPGRDLIMCYKRRMGNDRKVVIAEGNPRGRRVLIVDDMFQTCGTTIRCGEALTEAGAASVSAYATHGVFPENAHRRLTPERFEKVFVTDSCPWAVPAAAEMPNFEVLSIINDLHRILTH